MSVFDRSFVLASGFAFLIGVPQAATGAQLTGPQIKSAIAGKGFRLSGKRSGTVTFHASGRAVFKPKSKPSVTGSWWVTGNRYCSKFSVRRPQVICQTLSPSGNGRYKSSGGFVLTPR